MNKSNSSKTVTCLSLQNPVIQFHLKRDIFFLVIEKKICTMSTIDNKNGEFLTVSQKIQFSNE